MEDAASTLSSGMMPRACADSPRMRWLRAREVWWCDVVAQLCFQFTVREPGRNEWKISRARSPNSGWVSSRLGDECRVAGRPLNVATGRGGTRRATLRRRYRSTERARNAPGARASRRPVRTAEPPPFSGRLVTGATVRTKRRQIRQFLGVKGSPREREGEVGGELGERRIRRGH